MKRHWRTVLSRHGQLVLAAHVGQLPVQRERRFFRHPVDFKSRSLETLCDISTNSRLALEHGLSRENEHRIVAPIRDDLLNILPSGGKVSPLRVATEQLCLLRHRIETVLRAAKKHQEKN